MSSTTGSRALNSLCYHTTWEEEEKRFETIKIFDEDLFDLARQARSHEEVVVLLHVNGNRSGALRLGFALLQFRVLFATATDMMDGGIDSSHIWSLLFLAAQAAQRLGGEHFVANRLSTIGIIPGGVSDLLQASLEPAKKSELAIDIVFYMQLEISKLLRALYEYMRWGVKGPTHSEAEFRHHKTGQIWENSMQEIQSQLTQLKEVLKAQSELEGRSQIEAPTGNRPGLARWFLSWIF